MLRNAQTSLKTMKDVLARITLLTLGILFYLPSCLNVQCFQSEGRRYRLDGTDCLNSIITAVPFLRVVSDARSGAMGNAGIAISADANAIFFNASKLVFAEEDLSFSANYTPWLSLPHRES